MNRSRSTPEEDEAFKSRLVDDVFGKDNKGKVQMEKITMLIWQFRNDPDVVQFMARFVATYAGSRDVFDGIEFYLPQLAHMIIHLEADWDDAILERFALVIAQQSLHFALQLNWILQGAIEDYQPETQQGEPNPSHNPLFYSRCLKLLTNIERCVVYGKPRSHQLLKLYEKGDISKQEYDVLEQADRRFTAVQILSVAADNDSSEHQRNCGFGGILLYKRKVRSGCFKPKRWKTRYFLIDEVSRMLYCYSAGDKLKLVRAMPIEGAVVTFSDDSSHNSINGGNSKNTKYPHMFQVTNRNFEFCMRAESKEIKEQWIQHLTSVSKSQNLFPQPNSSSSEHNNNKKGASHDNPKEGLTPSQRLRYDFFHDEREFVANICEVAEKLRFKTPLERKTLAPTYMEELTIPPCAYIPMCNSTDIWRRIDLALPKDTKVFNTNERCPVIMNFISKRGEQIQPMNTLQPHMTTTSRNYRGGMKDVNLDVAEYIHLNFDMRSDNNLLKSKEEYHPPSLSIPVDASSNLQKEFLEETRSNDGSGEDDDYSISSSLHAKDTVWKEDRTGSSEPSSPTLLLPSTTPAIPKGNRQVQHFLKENFAKMPSQVLSRIKSRRNQKSFRAVTAVASPLPQQSVPIFEETPRCCDTDDDRVVSVRRSSILSKAGEITLGKDMDEDAIGPECIARAKKYVCHGENYAEKTARMLKDHSNKKATEKNDEQIQTEIVNVMAKSNDDLRQEVFVMQMIHYYKYVFANANLPLWLKTYRILSTSQTTGLIEVLTDATSIDGLKKSEDYPTADKGGMRAYFELAYGAPEGKSFKAAQANFMHSLVAYSLVSYLLGLKDRHNGNIMIDTRGHLIFIDFGFAMGMAPGHEFSMERAPFKLTKEYVEVMGGPDSGCFAEFKRLFVAAFKETRKNSQIALGLVEIMMYQSNYPCFTGPRYGHGVAFKKFEHRLMLNVPEKKVEQKALGLITKSMNHTGTHLYDVFQQHSNGYAI